MTIARAVSNELREYHVYEFLTVNVYIHSVYENLLSDKPSFLTLSSINDQEVS